MSFRHVKAQDTALEVGANFSYASLVQDKSKDGEINLSKNIYTSNDNALLPSTSPMSNLSGVDNGDTSSDQIDIYVIRKGDSISQIADMFGVSTNTILWANDMKKGDKLVEGEILFILPVSGVKHTVLKGQTLKGIASLYKVDVTDISGFNGIPLNAKLTAGDELIVPDGEISDDGNEKTTPKSAKQYIAKGPVKDLGGYFINPVPNYKRRSQGLHGKNGVDLAAPTGTKIVASASGKILLARTGYNGGYGNMVIIQHPNGTQTLYAHQSKLAVKTGEQVSQGETIGYIGSTGHSTGPHLHYEIRGAKNNAVNL